MRLAGRVFAGTAGVVVTVLAAALVAASASVRRAGDAAAQRGLEQAADLVAQFLAGRQRALAGGARVFAQEPYFRALVAAERRDDVLDQTIEGAEQLGADWVFITDGAGRLLAKSDEPGASGGALGGVPLVANALRGQVASGFGVSRDSLLFQAVAVPVAVPGGTPVGALVATELVNDRLARDVRAATAAEVVFYAIDAAGATRVAASSFESRDAARRALAAVRAAGRASEAGVASTADAQAPVMVGGTAYLVQGGAATTAGGDRAGGFVVLRRLDLERAELAGVQRSLLAAGAVGLVLALAAAWVTARHITRPIRALADATRRASAGDYGATEVLAAAGLVPTSSGDDPFDAGNDGASATTAAPGDEIGALGAAFATLLGDLRDRAALDRAALGVVQSLGPQGTGRGAPARVRGLELRRTTSRLAPGAVLAERYQIDAVLGRGGTGIVWRARDRTLGETIAVKVLRPELAAMGTVALEAFKEELRLARRLSHRNVVRLHDIGEDDGTVFLTMEFVEGASLAALLAAHGPLAAPAVLGVAKQLLRALEAAHRQGVVHGDLKPANLLLGAGGALKVADFGVARVIRAPVGRTPVLAGAAASGPDIVGATVGTPAFMAPELLLGGAPNVGSDLYAAGVVLQACLTGETPFDGDTPVAFFAHKLETPTGPTPAVHLAHATGGTVAAAVARLLAPDPATRPPSARAAWALFAHAG